MNKPLTVVSILFWILLTSCEKEVPLNIIWIVADDLGTDISPYGNEIIYTPHLKELASESVLYTNLHTVTAVCSPNRSALVTGRYPVSIHSHQHRTRFKEKLPEGVKPITDYFRGQGYFVTNGSYRGREVKGKTDYNFQASFEDLYDGTDWSDRRPGQPFFSQVQIFLPHRPFLTDSLQPVDPDKVTLPPYYPDTRLVRKDWAHYFETVQLVDREVGRIMNRLKEEGLLENTVVMFFGDQGRPHVRAKQFLYDAGTNTPLLVRYPGKRGAGKVSDKLVSTVDIPAATLALAGIRAPEDIHGIDFTDSSLKRDVLFTMRDRRDETVDRIRAVRTERYKLIRNYYPERPYTQFNVYKKTHYPALTEMQVMYAKGELNPKQALFMADSRPPYELYDLQMDSHELVNLAVNESYAAIREKLMKSLDSLVTLHDAGTYPEPPEEIAAAEELMVGIYQKFLEKNAMDNPPTDEQFLDYWYRKYGLEGTAD